MRGARRWRRATRGRLRRRSPRRPRARRRPISPSAPSAPAPSAARNSRYPIPHPRATRISSALAARRGAAGARTGSKLRPCESTVGGGFAGPQAHGAQAAAAADADAAREATHHVAQERFNRGPARVWQKSRTCETRGGGGALAPAGALHHPRLLLVPAARVRLPASAAAESLVGADASSSFLGRLGVAGASSDGSASRVQTARRCSSKTPRRGRLALQVPDETAVSRGYQTFQHGGVRRRARGGGGAGAHSRRQLNTASSPESQKRRRRRRLAVAAAADGGAGGARWGGVGRPPRKKESRAQLGGGGGPREGELTRPEAARLRRAFAAGTRGPRRRRAGRRARAEGLVARVERRGEVDELAAPAGRRLLRVDRDARRAAEQLGERVAVVGLQPRVEARARRGSRRRASRPCGTPRHASCSRRYGAPSASTWSPGHAPSGRTSHSTMWLSVPPVTTSSPRARSASASARYRNATTRPAYLERGRGRLLAATASAAMLLLCGPPCSCGKTAKRPPPPCARAGRRSSPRAGRAATCARSWCARRRARTAGPRPPPATSPDTPPCRRARAAAARRRRRSAARARSPTNAAGRPTRRRRAAWAGRARRRARARRQSTRPVSSLTPYGEALKVDGRRRDFLRRRVVPVREVAARGEPEPHQPVVRAQQRGVHREVRRRARVRLHVHAPLGRVEPKQAERAPRTAPRARRRARSRRSTARAAGPRSTCS